MAQKVLAQIIEADLRQLTQEARKAEGLAQTLANWFSSGMYD